MLSIYNRSDGDGLACMLYGQLWIQVTHCVFNLISQLVDICEASLQNGPDVAIYQSRETRS